MSEERAAYNATSSRSPRAGDKIACSVCGVIIGDLVPVNSALWLNLGAVKLCHGYGSCAQCNRSWFFDSNELRLRRIIHAIIKL